ncbi:MAG: ribosome-associated translation inhibitor RaiA [Chloroflexi bacterium]|nr:ribosome-associated translation inhibitor RaiA [Chloroflexota bacterium]
MDIQVKSRNFDVTEHLRTHIEKKVSKLERFLPSIDEARVDLGTQATKSTEDSMIVQLTLRANGAIMRAEERNADLYTALDTVLDKITRQIERYKGRHWRSLARTGSGQPDFPVDDSLAEELEQQVVRRKTFRTRPMTLEEAIEHMELLGHDFFIFFDATTHAFSVVYRRKDSGYGLLVPELE